MKFRKNIIFVAACLFVFFQPLYVSADRCDDVMEKASRIFDDATAASNGNEYVNAIKLYEKAEKYFKKVSKMKNCSCPKIAGTAKKNMGICRNNAAKNREAVESHKNYEAELEVVKIYNQAKMKFNQGNSFARSQQWERAISAFEEAEEIWERMASTETENGRRATQSAEQAHDLANLARQRMEK